MAHQHGIRNAVLGARERNPKTVGYDADAGYVYGVEWPCYYPGGFGGLESGIWGVYLLFLVVLLKIFFFFFLFMLDYGDARCWF